MNRANSRASFDIVHVFLDALVHLISFGITYSFFGGRNAYTGAQWKAFISLYLVCILVFLLINNSLNIYNNTVFFYIDRIFKRETVAFVGALCCGAIIYFNVSDIRFILDFIWWLLGTSYFLLTMQIVFFKGIIDKFIARKHVPRVLYVGSKDSYNKFRYFLGKTSTIVNEIGFISFDDDDESLEYIGKISDLESIIRKYNIDQIYILQKRDMDIIALQSYVDKCIEMGVTCRIIIDTFRRRKAFSYVSSVGTYPVYTFHTVPVNPFERVFKRGFDIVFSLAGIIVTLPIMIVTAIAIKLDSKGHVFFKQVRVGKNGRHFKIWKFRSMCMNAEEMKDELEDQNEMEDGLMFKIKNDPRITRVGRFIRKTSIDELPQFFNVLAGSMSVVGTRPPTIDEVSKYTAKQWRRISIKPGITGMWQVNGRSSVTNFDKIVELDTDYIDNWSMLLDIKIILKTITGVLTRKNSY
ncbi:sugar transferase [Butyrivibrio sp. VCB2001]|uniref:sugar transferase n=1 Tax=Butyrivibrio sp. VCB2001 TaxID=1280667 RepID=UPI00047D65A6|nr:sugar transferase [Butyrivibrio sp. VCB2001]